MLKVNPKILIIDDNPSIHDDFRATLISTKSNVEAASTKAMLFGHKKDTEEKLETPEFDLTFASQGQEGLDLISNSIVTHEPFSLAFVDSRMPPGMDGIETIKKMWEIDPDIEIVLCSAYSDYSWEDMAKELRHFQNFLILKKPFEVIEIRQLAASLTKKWQLKKQVKEQIASLQALTLDLDKSYSLTKTTLESTQEGILVLDLEGKVNVYNKKFLEIWNINDAQLINSTTANFIEMMLKQVEESEFFHKVVTTSFQNPQNIDNIKNTKEWKLKSGNVLELYVSPQYLKSEVIGTVFSFRDVTEAKQLREELLYQATHDSLTGLPNRILLHDRISQAIVQAKYLNLQVGVLLFDLDNFKQINDTLGHTAGDQLLQLLAKRLSTLIRESDTVTRLGGDEFVIVLASQASEEAVSILARKILDNILTPFKVANHEFVMTASIGISVYPKDGNEVETLLKYADCALYYAKDLGKNNFQFFIAEHNERNLQRIELMSALRLAQAKEQFSLHYQPLIELNTNKIIGVEALLRWNHPTLGMVPPEKFIPLAEETGLIIPIGEWVLKTACAQIKEWQKRNSTLKVAVNISVRQFQLSNFVETVKKILEETGLEAKYLELEITESVILANLPDTVEKIAKLKELGINLSIDDFGTGYASLGYLKYLSFDKIKIDKSFINGITVNDNNRSIVEAILALTKHFGMTVLAVGVEEEEQIQFIKEHHSDQVQGYYCSPPLDVASCAAVLKKNETEKV